MIAINSKLIAEIKIDNLNEIVAEELGKILKHCIRETEEPVGHWIKTDDPTYVQCSECCSMVLNRLYKYCPFCGCKMEAKQ